MKFCAPHWDSLTQAIKSRGLGDFVSATAEESFQRMKGSLGGKPESLKTFDPLMAAHNMIVNNAMRFASEFGGNPLALLFGDPEHPEHECPICYLNWLSEQHDKLCDNPDCQKERGIKFDLWIGKSASDVAELMKDIPIE